MIASQRYARSDMRIVTKASSRHFALLAILYAVAVIYSSLMLGPDGLHYVPISAAEAWQRFTSVSYMDNASDQRPDWIANLMMTIPLTFFMSGALFLRAGTREAIAAAITLITAIAFILAVKYAQLFFPPRTVTLNYIVAQSLGAALGIALFRVSRRRLYPALMAMYRGGEGLTVILGAYTVGLTAYFLMPFDLVLTPDDLATHLSQVPLSLAPGAGQGAGYRLFLLLADAAATIPVGMFLAVTGRDLPFKSLVLRGIGLIVPVTILSMFILSASPFALSLVTRAAGVAVGIWFMWALKGKDLWKRHYRYARYVPIVAPAYVFALLLVNGLVTTHWIEADRAIASIEPRQLLPLWSVYIASKADAARNVISAFCLFAPIGAMIWLKRGFWSKGAGLAAFLAFSLSLAIEIARTMRPGLSPDFTMPFVAALGAAVTFRSMATLWKMFEHEAKISVLRETHVAEIERVAAQVFNLAELRPAARKPAVVQAAVRRRYGGSLE